MKLLKFIVINLMVGKNNFNILIIKRKFIKQYIQYNIIFIFKVNTSKRRDKMKIENVLK